MKTTLAFLAPALAGALNLAAAEPPRPALGEIPLAETKVLGLAGKRLDACIRSQMSVKDAAYLASPFAWKGEAATWKSLEAGIWQTEFWGKYMHAAVPLADYCRDEAWKRRIGASVRAVVAA